ncbi:MAG TPA: penicillin acylase family protein, partial [Brevibacterium senegalense]|nr:penicillin acylase family protein [Brevibacterium senegalense]
MSPASHRRSEYTTDSGRTRTGRLLLVLRRVLLGALAAAVALAVVVTAVLVWSVNRAFPQTDGTVAVDGLAADVTVQRDGHGIPTLTATSTDDLFRAQGYVHAQDRFWEMDFRRHMTAGRLSELFGESQVPT